ncbi:MAG: AEC family transporter [Syntrophus sp. (in: bacteria)]
MSAVSLHVAETVIAFTLIVMVAYFMKIKGILKQEDSALFARLLTQAILPATIFYQLWTHPLSGESLAPVLIMFLSGTVSLAISWLIGVLLKFDRQSIGALMIVSSFGSSALIGYPIIQYAFANNPQALAKGIIISELGVGLPIFILCPAVAMYFGGTFKGNEDMRKLVKDYFLSPIFLSVVLGLVLSHLDVPAGTPFVDTIREALNMMQGSLVVISAVILGLQLSFQPMGGFWKLIAVSILVQMLFQPWFNDFVSVLLSVGTENRQILVLISAMPAAILGPVFAARYDCAAKTATLLTFTHIVISPVVVPAVFAIFT